MPCCLKINLQSQAPTQHLFKKKTPMMLRSRLETTNMGDLKLPWLNLAIHQFVLLEDPSYPGVDLMKHQYQSAMCCLIRCFSLLYLVS